jgi:hypothetical protein
MVAPQAARQPVVLAQAVEHGTADPLRRIGFEAGTETGFEAAHGIEQAEHAVLHQIVELHARRQTRQQMAGDTLDQRREALDKLILVELTGGVIHAVQA